MTTSKARIWLTATRPKTLWAAVAPVIIGVSLAYSDNLLHVPSALAALAGALLIQIGTNYANDYYDYKRGADTESRLGPVRATQSGLVTAGEMKRAFIIVFALAFVIGIYLIWRGGAPVLAIGIASILFGLAYTGGPYPLGYHGFGDIAVFVFFGPVAVGGTYYVQTLDINRLVILAGIAPGLLSLALLTVNNLRDLDADRQAGKKTTAVRFGRSYTKFQYLTAIVAACLIPVALYLISGAHFYSTGTILVLIIAIPSILKIFRNDHGEALNKVLADTGKILILFSLVFSAGWIV